MNDDVNIGLLTTKYWQDQIPKLTDNYEDPYFPPDSRSILAMDLDYNYKDEDGEKNSEMIPHDDIIWKRVGKILGDYSVFVQKIEASDVKQGGIGNCYFLSVLASFAVEKQKFIHSLFRTKEKNEDGIYEIVFFIDGEWQIVFVDDYFPINKSTGDFFFSKPNGSELWVILLEKAFAKINGGYINTNAGYASDPIYAISGFPTETFFSEEIEKNELFKKILEAKNLNSLICGSSISQDDIHEKGLVKGHVYAIMNIIDDYIDDIQVKDEVKLVKLRNPWGYYEWIGEWSDSSESWNEYLKNKYQVIEKDDGIFHMSIIDYQKYFEYTNISYMFYGSNVKCYKITYSKFPLVFNLELNEDGKVCFSIIKKHWRYNNRKLKYKKRPFSLVIINYINNKSILSIDGQYRVYENVEYIDNLQKGKYFLIIICPTEHYTYDNELPDKPLSTVFRICTKSSFNSKFTGVDMNYNLLEYLIVNSIKTDFQQLIESCKSYFTIPYKVLEWSGLKCFVIINKKNCLQAKVKIREKEQVSFFENYLFGKEEEVIKIKPNQGIAVIAQYGDISKEVKCEIDYDIEVFGVVKEEDNVKNKRIITNDFLKSFTNSSNEYSNDFNPIRKKKTHTTISYKKGKLPHSIIQVQDSFRKRTNINNEDVPQNESFGNSPYMRKATNSNMNNNNYNEKDDELDDDLSDELRFFFKPDFSFDNLEFYSYSVINEDEVNNVPLYKNIYTGRDFIIYEYDKIDKKYIKNMKRLSEYEDFINDLYMKNEEEEGSNILSLTTIHEIFHFLSQTKSNKWAVGKLKDGIFIGQLHENEYIPHGKGVFIMNSKEMYVGIWLNGYLEKYGRFYNKIDKITYEGNFESDVKSGIGRFYLKNNEIYEGEFSNNGCNGSGVFYFKDKRIWIGYFVSNYKERTGVMMYPDGKIEISTYLNNTFNGSKSIDEILFTKFSENCISINRKIQKIKEVTKINDILIMKNNDLIEIRKKEAEDNYEYIVDVEEKNRLLRLKKIKEKDPFMYEFVMKHKKEVDKNQIVYVKDEFRKANYLGQVNKDLAYEQNGGLKFEFQFCISCRKFKKEEEIERIDKEKLENNENEVNIHSRKSIVEVDIDEFINKNKEKDKNKKDFYSPNKENHEKRHEKLNLFESKTANLQKTSLIQNEEKNNSKMSFNVNLSNQLQSKIVKYTCHESHIRIKYLFSSFFNDKINGKVFLFDENHRLIYKGSVEKELIPHGKGEIYYENGDMYNGDFYKGVKHGKGSLTNSSGDMLVCQFENDLATGEGLMYEKDNPIPYTVNYIGGVKVIEKPKIKPYIEKHRESLRAIYKEYPIILSIILSYIRPSISDNNNLQYERVILDNNMEYIGQVNEKGDFSGRGCLIFDKESDEENKEKYYIGYFQDNKRTKYGMYFDSSFNLLYEGEFDENYKNGHGRDFLIGLGIYDGEFVQSKWHGDGVYIFGESGRVEGRLSNSYFEGRCKYIYDGLKLIEIIQCSDGNVVDSIEITKITSEEKRLEIEKSEYLGIYSDYINKIDNLEKTKEHLTLSFGKLEKKDGLYIGELNFNNKPHGRGIFQYRKGKYYIGYWVNGYKEGYGMDYFEDSLLYEGNYRRNNKYGYGVYYYDTQTIYGCFTIDGCSNYVVTVRKGEYFIGEFEYNKYVGLVYYIRKNRYCYIKYFNSIGNEREYKMTNKKVCLVSKGYVADIKNYIQSFKYSKNNQYYLYNSEILSN